MTRVVSRGGLGRRREASALSGVECAVGASLSIAAVMAERSARIERRDVAGAALVSEVLVHLGAATPFMEAEARGIRSRGPLRRPPLTPAQWTLLWSDRARDPVALDRRPQP